MPKEIPVVGNLTADPELRYSPSGTAVLRFTVAENTRRFDKTTNEWADEEPNFYDVTAFGELAEFVAESLHKGDRLIVVGKLKQDRWETTDGDKRSKIVVIADEVGPSLRWASAEVTRAQRNGGGNGANRQGETRTKPDHSERPFTAENEIQDEVAF